MMMSKIGHPARLRALREVSRRNPETEWEDIYRRLVFWEFSFEARGGFQVALYRPEAVPRMAAVLANTGHIQANPGKRTLDTGIVILELIHGGFDSKRGQKMVRLLRALHDRPDILQEDMTYVLNSLIVVPARFIARMGWRPLCEVEETASVRFWSELGRRIGVAEVAETYEEAVRQFDAYEEVNLAPSVEGRRMTQLILDALAGWTPKLLRPYTGAITSTLIDDVRFSDALGLDKPPRWIVVLVHVLYGVRRVRNRFGAPPSAPAFVPGQPAGTVYPNGYDIDRLGPQPAGSDL